MSDEDGERISSKNFHRTWRPRLVELTKAPHPVIADGNPTKLYMEPSDVVCIERGVVRWQLDDGTNTDSQECTVITLTRGYAHVLEAPEEVAHRVSAAMREKS